MHIRNTMKIATSISMLEINSESEFEKILSTESNPVVVDFWAPYCIPFFQDGVEIKRFAGVQAKTNSYKCIGRLCGHNGKPAFNLKYYLNLKYRTLKYATLSPSNKK